MILSSYVDEADNLIQSFLTKLKTSHSEEVFTPNVHAMLHLAWQVGSLRPLWTTSAMMFESANYILQSKFTGTVNHLQLLVERYIRNKDMYRANTIIGKCNLVEVARKVRGKQKFCRRTIVVGIPTDVLQEGKNF